jgi:adenylyltransferase/sulfurtransferase
MMAAGSMHAASARLEIDARLAGSPGLGADALALLRGSTVALIGLGALGGPVGMHLASLGVALVLVDPDVVSLANLGNQLWPAASVGEAKSEARARQLAALNPECPLAPISARIEDLGLAALAGVGLLITGLDGRAARLRVAELSLRLGIPWVDAAVDGTGQALRGTVTVFDPRLPDTACYGCRLDAADLGTIAKEGRGLGCPSWRRDARALTPPTLQASAFGGVIAGYQAIVATRVLLGRAGELIGRQLVVECDTAPRLRMLGLTPNPRCLIGHHRLAPLRVVAGEQIGEVLVAAAAALGTPAESLGFHGRMLAVGLTCPGCAARRDVVRVAEAVSDADATCACGVEMVPERLVSEVSAAELRMWSERTWTDLGLPVADVVTARASGVEAHFVLNVSRQVSVQVTRRRRSIGDGSL